MSTAEIGTVLDTFSFRPESETYLARYDQTETPASLAVIATIAEILDTDPMEMDPLFYSVDIESLDELLGGRAGDDLRVTATFAGVDFTVTGDAVIATRARDGGVGTEEFSPT